MSLNYLDFDYSEDTDGTGTFDAMASVAPSQLAAVQAEIEEVLRWAHATFAGGRGPIDEGFDWDHDVQGQREYTAQDRIRFDEATGRLMVEPGEAGVARHTVTLSLSGSQAFCEAFRQAFVSE